MKNFREFDDFSAIVATFNTNAGREDAEGRIILVRESRAGHTQYITWNQRVSDGATFSGNYFNSRKEGEKDFLRRVLTHTGFGIHLDEGRTGIWTEVEK